MKEKKLHIERITNFEQKGVKSINRSNYREKEENSTD